MRWAAVAAIALAGCATHVDPLTFPVGEAGSTLFVEIAGGEVAVYAFHFDDPAPSVVGAPFPDQDADLYVLHYACTLACLGLDEGKQTLATGGEPLALPKTLFASTFVDQKVATWHPLDALPDPLKALRIVAPHPIDQCLRFDSTAVNVTTVDLAQLMVPVDGEEMLVGDSTELFRVSRTGSIRLDDPLYANARGSIAGFKEESGSIWLLKAGGELLKGDLENGFTKQADVPLPAGPAFAWIDGALDGSELYIATSQRSLAHYANGTVTVLAPGGTGKGDDSGGLARLPNGDVIALGDAPDELLRVTQGRFSRERIVTADPLTAVGSLQDLGVVLGGERGRLYLMRGAMFVVEQSEQYVSQVRIIGGIAGSVIYGGEYTLIAEYNPDFGFCEAQNSPGDNSKRLVSIANGFARLADIQHAPNTPSGSLVAFDTLVKRPDPSCECR